MVGFRFGTVGDLQPQSTPEDEGRIDGDRNDGASLLSPAL